MRRTHEDRHFVLCSRRLVGGSTVYEVHHSTTEADAYHLSIEQDEFCDVYTTQGLLGPGTAKREGIGVVAVVPHPMG